MNPLATKLTTFLLLLSSGLVYYFLTYRVAREDFLILFAGFTVLFGAYLGLYFISRRLGYFKTLLSAGIIFRLMLLFSVPELSDDYYRFLWDGNRVTQWENPYLSLPSEVNSEETGEYLQKLYSGLNSPDYYSVYPPVVQGVAATASWIGGREVSLNLMVIKGFFLAAELCTIFLLLALLKHLDQRKENALLYVLNPLVILELMGNLHFEALMITFLLAAVLLFYKNKNSLSGALYGLAVLTKVLPLALGPYFLFRSFFRVSASFFGAAFLVILIGIVPFYSGGAAPGNFFESLLLYFGRFELNASLYYVVREVGYYFKGYNIIGTAAPVMSFISMILILTVSWFFRKKRDLLIPLTLILTIHLLFATTVHPWYVIPVFAFSLFTPFKFPLLWTFTAFLSYHAYSGVAVEEDLWILSLEYIPVYILMIFEVGKKGGLRSFDWTRNFLS